MTRSFHLNLYAFFDIFGIVQCFAAFNVFLFLISLQQLILPFQKNDRIPSTPRQSVAPRRRLRRKIQPRPIPTHQLRNPLQKLPSNTNSRTLPLQRVQKFGPTTSIWSFLGIFRMNFGKKIEIFKIAFPARPSGSFYWTIWKISIFWPKFILKIPKKDQISEPDQND